MVSGISHRLCFAVRLSGRLNDLPGWLRPHWSRFSFVLEQLQHGWSRKLENKLKALIKEYVPLYAEDLLAVNSKANSLHMQFLREAFETDDLQWMRRALQFGERHASFPLLFDWAAFPSELRKFVVFCFVRFFRGGRHSSLRILPCSIMKLVDFVEWLPSAGLDVGWRSIRHYVGWVQSFSMVCGYGTIREEDEAGFKIWKDNFKANVQISRAPRGGDLPLKPWHLRSLATVFSSGSSFDTMMLSMVSLMWFTALRPGHFSPESLQPKHLKHMLAWGFCVPYQAHAFGTARSSLHLRVPTAKSNQAEQAAPWSTATACICESFYDCTEAEWNDLHALCPVCALERWRQSFPTSAQYQQYVFVEPATGAPILRSRFNKVLRAALEQALYYLPPAERAAVLQQLSAKSWRSGAGTELVTTGNAGFVAAAFLAHGCPEITQKYYHKSGDQERLQLLPALAGGLLG